MSDKKKIEKIVTKEEFLEFIKELETQLQQGYVMVLDQKVELPEKFEMEFKYEEEEHEKKIEIEIKWKS